MRNPFAYKIDLNIFPNWVAILRKYYPELNEIKTNWVDGKWRLRDIEHLAEAYDSGKMEAQKNAVYERLSQLSNWLPPPETKYLDQSCSFSIFKEERSGLELIWSRDQKTFVDRIISRPPFMSGFVIKPDEIGFKDNVVDDTDHLLSPTASLPYEYFVEFLNDIHMRHRNVMRKFRSLGEEMQKIFTENKAMYIPDFEIDHDNKAKEDIEVDDKTGAEISSFAVSAHILHANHYALSLRMKQFEEWDDYPDNDASGLGKLFRGLFGVSQK